MAKAAMRRRKNFKNQHPLLATSHFYFGEIDRALHQIEATIKIKGVREVFLKTLPHEMTSRAEMKNVNAEMLITREITELNRIGTMLGKDHSAVPCAVNTTQLRIENAFRLLKIASEIIMMVEGEFTPQAILGDTFSRITRIVAENFGVTIEMLKGRKRATPIRYARILSVYLCREITGASYFTIGAFFQRQPDEANKFHKKGCSLIAKSFVFREKADKARREFDALFPIQATVSESLSIPA